MSNAKTKLVHISEISAGDTIIHEGKLTTVSYNDIRVDSFIGRTLFGDSYRLGFKSVQKVVAWIGKDGSEWPVK